MATGKINPAFQTAQFFGASSFDPVEFNKRQGLLKLQDEQTRKSKVAKNTVAALDMMMVDLKAWDDKAGLKEIVDRQKTAKDVVLNLVGKGFDLFNPKTPEEIQVFKAATDYLAETKQLADMRNAQGLRWDAFQKAAAEDALKPEDERAINAEATIDKRQDYLGTNSIAKRTSKGENIMVLNMKVGDMYKYVKDNYKPTPFDSNQTAYLDPKTGVTSTVLKEKATAEWVRGEEKKLGELYDNSKEDIKTFVKKHKTIDPQLAMSTDRAWFIAMNMPNGREREIHRITGGGGGNFNFSLGGSKVKVTPGEFQNNDFNLGERTIRDRWNVDSKPPYKIPTAGGKYMDSEDGKWIPIDVPDIGEANFLNYVPNTNEAIFRTTTASGGMAANTTFTIPASNIKELEKYPITLPNGKPGTLKDVMSKGATGVKKKPEWNPKTKKFE